MNIDHIEIDKKIKNIFRSKNPNERYKNFDMRAQKEIEDLMGNFFSKRDYKDIYFCFPAGIEKFFEEIVNKNLIEIIYNRRVTNFLLKKSYKYKNWLSNDIGYLMDCESFSFIKFIKKDNFLFMRMSNKKEFFRIYIDNENRYVMQEINNKKIISQLTFSSDLKKLHFKSKYPNGQTKKELNSVENIFDLKEVSYTLAGKVSSVRYLEFNDKKNYFIKKPDIEKQTVIIKKNDVSDWVNDYIEDIIDMSDYEMSLLELNFTD